MIYINNKNNNTKIPMLPFEYTKEGFITLLSTEDYLDGVLTLYQSLLDNNTRYRMCCIVTDDIVDKVRPYLEDWGIEVIVREKIFYSHEMYDETPDLYTLPTASKVHIYDLNPNIYNKMLYVDCDMFALSNIDELFKYPIGSIACWTDGKTYDGISCMFMYHPDNNTFNVLKFVATHMPHMLDGSIISALFSDNVQNENMRIDPLKYGHGVCLWGLEEGQHITLPQDVKMIHFHNSPIKPWNLNPIDYKRLEEAYDCMPKYTECLKKVRERKKQIEASLN